MSLTRERLHEVLSYDEATGVFIRRIATGRHGRWKAGEPAGCESSGYMLISVDYRLYKAHRLAWFYVHGVWPKEDVDHIDGNGLNNSMCNLRTATRSENMQNLRKARKDNRSGLLGAHWDEKSNRWFSRIKVDGEAHWLGYHPTAVEAAAAYIDAKRKLHPRGML